jgi:4'-phosphopantetheinyl transferase
MQKTTRQFELAGRQVVVIEAAVPSEQPVAASLSEAEHAAAARFRRTEDQIRYVAAHVLLREALAEASGASPHEIRFDRAPCPRCGGPHGRPVLAEGAGPAFSLSHSRRRVLVALCDAPVGVDVEHVAAVTRPGALDDLVAVVHPAERAALAALPAPRREVGLLRCWVRKEAYLKGTGEGLGDGVDSVLVGVDDLVHPPGWRLADLPVEPEYLAAVAIPAG